MCLKTNLYSHNGKTVISSCWCQDYLFNKMWKDYIFSHDNAEKNYIKLKKNYAEKLSGTTVI